MSEEQPTARMMSSMMTQLPARLFNSGLASARAGACEQAALLLGAAVSLDPRLTVAHVVLGKANAHLGRWDAAIAAWERALEIDPGCSAARVALARASEMQGSARRDSRRRRLRVVAGALAAFVVTLCLPATFLALIRMGQPSPEARVEQALRAAPQLVGAQLRVRRDRSTFQLAGEVRDAGQQALAVALARAEVPGAPVDARDLRVHEPSTLAETVRRVLAATSRPRVVDLRVADDSGRLVLRGLVLRASDRALAERLVLALPGVTSVDVNGLQLAAVSHRVCPGESLWSLAGRYYGDATEWRRIRRANLLRIESLTRLRVGEELVIPTLESNEKRLLP